MLWIAGFNNLLDAFFIIIMTFIVISISFVLIYAPIEIKSDNNLSSEIKELKSKLDDIAKDIEEIKK